MRESLKKMDFENITLTTKPMRNKEHGGCLPILSSGGVEEVASRGPWFSEKMLISNRCISGLMSNLIKKS